MPVTFDDVLAARARLRGIVNETPVVTSSTLDARAQASVFCKCEQFQRTGAFKFRGAYNTLEQLARAEGPTGVLSYSSGNHAQALALAGRMLGVPTTIVMPKGAPAVKLAATRGYGANVVLYDPAEELRETLARRLAKEQGLPIIPPYDHPHIVAGQGTAALELLSSHPSLDFLLVPCGGGGLLSGSAVAASGSAPGCKVIGVEPLLADDATRSFRTGTLQTVHNPDTIADGARTPSLGAVTFPLVMGHVHDMVTVTEEAIRDAVCFLWERMKLVVEPTGALAVAALLSGAFVAPGRRVGLILSGGNVTMPRLLA